MLYRPTKSSMFTINIIKISILRYNYVPLVSQEDEKKMCNYQDKINFYNERAYFYFVLIT